MLVPNRQLVYIFLKLYLKLIYILYYISNVFILLILNKLFKLFFKILYYNFKYRLARHAG
jgi:hypothetical protein